MIKRDSEFFKYKLMQIIVFFAVSIVIYIIIIIFDLDKPLNNKNIPLDTIKKDDLRPQNIIKSYFPPDKKSNKHNNKQE